MFATRFVPLTRSMLFGAAVICLAASQSFGVLLYRSATRNTSPPTGEYANSGWQYQAQFHAFSATPVAPNWFITAAHAGGVSTVSFQGTTYNVDASFVGSGPGWINGPNSDLRLFKITGSFPTWAPLWDASVDGTEVGKELVVYGRGTQRGAPVFGRASAPRDGTLSPGSRIPVSEQKGWLWGDYDGLQSWGANHVDSIFDATPFDLGHLLTFDFDRNSPLTEEAALSNWDSGGAMYIKSGTTWKLAGINFSVDGPFKQRPTGQSFLGSMFDMGGLYIDSNPLEYIPDGAADVPGSSYVSRISSNLAWIRSYIGPAAEPPTNVPEPASAFGAMMVTCVLAMRRRRSAS